MKNNNETYATFELYDINLTPEERLLHAILWRTIKDLFTNEPQYKRSAISFILSKKKTKKEWSFRWICEHIGLNPEKIINHVKKYQHKMKDSYLEDILLGR